MIWVYRITGIVLMPLVLIFIATGFVAEIAINSFFVGTEFATSLIGNIARAYDANKKK